MSTGGCQLCGCELFAARQCVMPIRLPDDQASLVPAHCYKCHFAAISVAKGTYKGKVLPPPHAQPANDYRGAFEQDDHSESLQDPRRR